MNHEESFGIVNSVGGLPIKASRQAIPTIQGKIEHTIEFGTDEFEVRGLCRFEPGTIAARLRVLASNIQELAGEIERGERVPE